MIDDDRRGELPPAVQRAVEALHLLITRARDLKGDLQARGEGGRLQPADALAVAVAAETSTARLSDEHLASVARRLREGAAP